MFILLYIFCIFVTLVLFINGEYLVVKTHEIATTPDALINVGNSDGSSVQISTSENGLFGSSGEVVKSGMSSYNTFTGGSISPGSSVSVADSHDASVTITTGKRRAGDVNNVGIGLGNSVDLSKGFNGKIDMANAELSSVVSTTGHGSVIGKKSGSVKDSGMATEGKYISNGGRKRKNVYIGNIYNTNLTLATGDAKLFARPGSIKQNALSSNNTSTQ